MFSFIVFSLLIFLMIIRVPIGLALGITSVIGLLMMDGMNLAVVIQRLFTSNDSFPLLAIPFFILAGEIMTAGGVSGRLVKFAASLVGHMRGGLATVAILASSFFAAISGSNAATVAAIGGVMAPTMKEKGYSPDYTAATIAAAGVTGMIIPPSILLILYGVITGASIGSLFIAGFLPGIFICLSLILLNWFLVKHQNVERSTFQGLQEIWFSFKKAFWALMMPVIILGGIYGGLFTPTEAAAVAVFYGFIMGLIYRELSWKKLYNVFLRATISTAIVMFVMNNAGLFGWFITINQIPQEISTSLTNLAANKIFFLILVNILLLIVGCFMNAAAAIAIFTSILFPAALSFGIDPILFGIVMVVNLSIGTVTPPLGVDLFIASTICKVPLERIITKVWPYILILIFDLLIITFYAPLTLFLVDLLTK